MLEKFVIFGFLRIKKFFYKVYSFGFGYYFPQNCCDNGWGVCSNSYNWALCQLLPCCNTKSRRACLPLSRGKEKQFSFKNYFSIKILFEGCFWLQFPSINLLLVLSNINWPYRNFIGLILFQMKTKKF